MATAAELDALARLAWAEAGRNHGPQAVADVIYNRIQDDRFNNDIIGVVEERGRPTTANPLGRYEFDPMFGNDSYQDLPGPNDDGGPPADFVEQITNHWNARDAGLVEDQSAGAIGFVNPDTGNPAGFRGQTATFGDHDFYNEFVNPATGRGSGPHISQPENSELIALNRAGFLDAGGARYAGGPALPGPTQLASTNLAGRDNAVQQAAIGASGGFDDAAVRQIINLINPRTPEGARAVMAAVTSTIKPQDIGAKLASVNATIGRAMQVAGPDVSLEEAVTTQAFLQPEMDKWREDNPTWSNFASEDAVLAGAIEKAQERMAGLDALGFDIGTNLGELAARSGVAQGDLSLTAKQGPSDAVLGTGNQPAPTSKTVVAPSPPGPSPATPQTLFDATNPDAIYSVQPGRLGQLFDAGISSLDPQPNPTGDLDFGGLGVQAPPAAPPQSIGSRQLLGFDKGNPDFDANLPDQPLAQTQDRPPTSPPPLRGGVAARKQSDYGAMPGNPSAPPRPPVPPQQAIRREPVEGQVDMAGAYRQGNAFRDPRAVEQSRSQADLDAERAWNQRMALQAAEYKQPSGASSRPSSAGLPQSAFPRINGLPNQAGGNFTVPPAPARDPYARDVPQPTYGRAAPELAGNVPGDRNLSQGYRRPPEAPAAPNVNFADRILDRTAIPPQPSLPSYGRAAPELAGNVPGDRNMGAGYRRPPPAPAWPNISFSDKALDRASPAPQRGGEMPRTPAQTLPSFAPPRPSPNLTQQRMAGSITNAQRLNYDPDTFDAGGMDLAGQTFHATAPSRPPPSIPTVPAPATARDAWADSAIYETEQDPFGPAGFAGPRDPANTLSLITAPPPPPARAPLQMRIGLPGGDTNVISPPQGPAPRHEVRGGQPHPSSSRGLSGNEALARLRSGRSVSSSELSRARSASSSASERRALSGRLRDRIRNRGNRRAGYAASRSSGGTGGGWTNR